MSKTDVHEYHRPLGIRVSNIVAILIMSIGVSFGLPPDTNFLLGLFLVLTAMDFTDRMHYKFLELPLAREWYVQHMAEYHHNE